ncbi:RrF2 family transcriptional regulator [Clostridium omnivorum]|uniref:Rrf2 family transcriptional regulator n=1 Tax=Clostridium omnivorum TaxID=1604902 RepID=A0ABQ5N598_9CLOT|nr:Rrf2 family transcriptional regulator [Clostridium sp. E14]GLC30294.1 Rrf2 family transcriptional regulator [Clostridium sp. E14]
MQFSIGVEYALHCLLYMVDIPSGKSVGIKDLATYQGVSETYLSKVYTKLKKSGIVKSIPGVNGGYELALSPENITFWDVVEAIEGNSPLFQCAEIRQKELLIDKNNLPDTHTKCPCLIKVVMLEAEEQMRQYLKKKTLAWLHEQLKNKIPEENRKATIEWFNNTKSR